MKSRIIHYTDRATKSIRVHKTSNLAKVLDLFDLIGISYKIKNFQTKDKIIIISFVDSSGKNSRLKFDKNNFKIVLNASKKEWGNYIKSFI